VDGLREEVPAAMRALLGEADDCADLVILAMRLAESASADAAKHAVPAAA